jgi:lipoprotein-anchoring transpeptidase ErfK/SrfK
MVSRRAVLKSIAFLGLSAAAGRALPVRAQDDGPLTADRWHGEPLARIAQAYQPARAEPTTDADAVTELLRDDVVRVRRLVHGQQVYGNADLWLETKVGYLYAPFVQPMYFHLPAPPVADLGAGRWAELIVPYSEAFERPDPADLDGSKGRVHYGSTYRVDQLVTGADGKSWYRVREQYQTIYLHATHLRLIPDADLAPLSPDVPTEEKRLTVDLPAQTITAYEYGEPVWSSSVSTGVTGHETPAGTHFIWQKRISERMVADTVSDDPDFYNLPGVPFVCYFTDNWIATHGTYWHNDYGRPRSHGCVNMSPAAARWVWRWSTPHYPIDEFYDVVTNRLDGTRVIVRA